MEIGDLSIRAVLREAEAKRLFEEATSEYIRMACLREAGASSPTALETAEAYLLSRKTYSDYKRAFSATSYRFAKEQFERDRPKREMDETIRSAVDERVRNLAPPPSKPKSFGASLREAREKIGWSQEKLAAELKQFGQGRISDIETGKSDPQISSRPILDDFIRQVEAFDGSPKDFRYRK